MLDQLFASDVAAAAAAAVGRRDGAARRLDLFGPAGRGRASAGWRSPISVIILCPKHRPDGASWAVAPHRRWLFPGGELASDPESGRAAGRGRDRAWNSTRRPIAQEHAIEVQLPLLARLAPQVRVVGIAVGDSPLPELLRFGVAMSVVLRDMPQRPLLVVSSDMNHFADDAQTRRLDRLALDAIATLDPEQVYETVRRNRISMCGMAPCVVVMEALRWLGS